MAERVVVILARQEKTEESTEEDNISVSQDTQRTTALLFLITEEGTKINLFHSQHIEHLSERVLRM